MTHQWPFSSTRSFGLDAAPSSRSSGLSSGGIEPDALESVLACAEVGVWQLFADGQSFVVTPATYPLLGVPDDERPDTCEQWLTRVHPADLDRVAGELDRLRDHTGPFTLEAQVLGTGQRVSLDRDPWPHPP